MSILFTCPRCGKSTNFADNYAGQTGPCPHCGQPVTVPAWSQPLSEPTKPASRGSSLLITLLAVGAGGFVLFVCGGMLVALLLPAVTTSREAARRVSCSNNLKQIGLALHNYSDVYGTFPPAYMTDSAGNPTVSWRVLILPFLNQEPLYRQLDTQQPWNSPANAALLSASIPVYRCPSSVDPSSTATNYMVVTGAETLFPYERAVSLRDVTDGLSNTIAVVEVEEQGVHWAAPEDLERQNLTWAFAAGADGQMGSRHTGGIQVLLGDASVRYFPDTIDPANLAKMLTIAGDERVDLP
ncbi:DUF1559 domain-containing protein [Candidatus Laterigemmans baculatus]|uniref:DUF1559 domain-containing protein n=1 Tax=Candidatus Laterigemmans baculatus TaxID=2770505 RepID=UPI0013DC8989|nr:DUF1559 domain-containing protein [Candidatus Laterigemmans baculatus]